MHTSCANQADFVAAVSNSETIEIQVPASLGLTLAIDPNAIQCKKLKKLSIPGSKISFDTLAAIINLPLLEDLDISDISIKSTSYNNFDESNYTCDSNLNAALINAELPHLKRLWVNDIKIYPAHHTFEQHKLDKARLFGAAILDGARNLQLLQANNSFFTMFDKNFWQQRELCKLKVLGLGGIAKNSIIDTIMQKVAPNLENINIEVELGQSFEPNGKSKLQFMQANGSEPDLCAIWNNYPDLRAIKFHITRRPPYGILSSNNLNKINLNKLESFAWQGGVIHQQTLSKILSSPKLEELRLEDIELFSFNLQSLLSITNNCVNLRSITIHHVMNFPFNSIIQLISSFETLEKICIGTQPYLSPEPVILDSKMINTLNLSELKTLKLSGMKIELQAFKDLIAKADQVEELELTRCKIIGLTSKIIFELKLSNLRNLKLNRNTFTIPSHDLLHLEDQLKDVKNPLLYHNLQLIRDGRIKHMESTEVKAEIRIKAAMLLKAPWLRRNQAETEKLFAMYLQLDPSGIAPWNKEMCNLATNLLRSKHWRNVDDNFIKNYLLNVGLYLENAYVTAIFIRYVFKQLPPEQSLRLIARPDMLEFYQTVFLDFYMHSSKYKAKHAIVKLYSEHTNLEIRMKLLQTLLLYVAAPSENKAAAKAKNKVF